MDFNGIVGQNEIVEALKAQIKNNKIGHAYIFSGPSGIGKRTMAEVFSSILLCSDQGSTKRCGSCQSCLLFDNNSNPDYYVLEAEEASIKIEGIRNMLHHISTRPLYSGRKIYLIPEAEKMTVQAQNCLLKTLEEPPDYTTIILTVVSYESLLETIRSRCVRYNFKKNTFSEVREFLKVRFGANIDGIDYATSYSDGVIGRALDIWESDGFKEMRDKLFDIILKLNESKLIDVFNVYSFFDDNKDIIDSVLDLMLVFYRDFLVFRKTGNENVLINSDKKDIILNNMGRFSEEKLHHNIKVIENAYSNIKRNANYQLAIEVMLMKLQEEGL